MSWRNIAFAFIFFCNLLFMVGTVLVLIRILDSVEKSGIDLQKAASGITDAGTQLRLMVRRAFNEMEQNNDSVASRENINARAVTELSFQIKNLQDQWQDNFARLLARSGEGGAAGGNLDVALDDPEAAAAEARTRLQADLKAALVKNHELQGELEQTQHRLKGASATSGLLQQEIGSNSSEVKPAVVESLKAHATELEQQLRQAQERAKAAERHAEANAAQLDDIRAQIAEQQFASGVAQRSEAEQAAQLAARQEQIDALIQREKNLLARIEEMKQEFARNDTEKHFIEDRFLQLAEGAKILPDAPGKPSLL